MMPLKVLFWQQTACSLQLALVRPTMLIGAQVIPTRAVTSSRTTPRRPRSLLTGSLLLDCRLSQHWRLVELQELAGSVTVVVAPEPVTVVVTVWVVVVGLEPKGVAAARRASVVKT